MSLRIGCDLDGTLADMETALQQEAERLFGPGVDLRASLQPRRDASSGATSGVGPPAPGEPVPAAHGAGILTRSQVRELWSHIGRTEDFWMSLQEVEPGAVAEMSRVAHAQRWEVLFLTQRPPSAGAVTQIQSQRWLVAHGFELPSVVVVSGLRGRVAAALELDAVLDDRPENCVDVAASSNARSLLVWRRTRGAPPPGAARVGIDVVGSIAEALERLERLRPQATGDQGFLARVRERLGI